MNKLIEEIENYYQQIVKLEKQNDEVFLKIESEDYLEKIMKNMLILDIEELDIVRRTILRNINHSYYKPYSHFKKLNAICTMLQDLKYNLINLDENIITESVNKFFKSIKEVHKIEIVEYGFPSYDYNTLKQKNNDTKDILPSRMTSNIEDSTEILNESTMKYEIQITLPEEITLENRSNLIEGSKKQIVVNAYERSTLAKKECIERYGYKCTVCNFDFEKVYGEIGKGFIHVHHLKPLSEIDEEYEINPLTDLRPVCPNCHAMLHKKNPVYSIEEIRNFINKKNL